VVVFSTSPGKRAAVEALGAQFINSHDDADMAAIAGQPASSHPPTRLSQTHMLGELGPVTGAGPGLSFGGRRAHSAVM
jgi:hypothetical protein